MKVGDLVSHRHGTLQGAGIILKIVSGSPGFPKVCHLLWTGYGQTKIHNCEMMFMEVISASR